MVLDCDICNTRAFGKWQFWCIVCRGLVDDLKNLTNVGTMAGIQDSLRRLQESIKGLSDASALVGTSTASNASESDHNSISSPGQNLDHIFQNDHPAQAGETFSNRGNPRHQRCVPGRARDTARGHDIRGGGEYGDCGSSRSSTHGGPSNNAGIAVVDDSERRREGSSSSRRLGDERDMLLRQQPRLGVAGTAGPALLSASDGLIMGESAEVIPCILAHTALNFR